MITHIQLQIVTLNPNGIRYRNNYHYDLYIHYDHYLYTFIGMKYMKYIFHRITKGPEKIIV